MQLHRKKSLLAKIMVFATLLSALPITPGIVNADVVTPLSYPDVDGIVKAIAVAPDGTTYIGGNFTRIGLTHSGNGLAFDGTTAAAQNYPNVSGGRINSSASDGSGGWYIGGSFTSVSGTSQAYLAHILSDGTVDTGFAPTVETQVDTVLYYGGIVYFGGYFTTVNGNTRNRVAAVNPSGVLQSWDPDANGTVEALVAIGSTIYIGGQFTSVSGNTRNALAAVSTGGVLDPGWVPDVGSFFPAVYALATDGTDIYIGGSFDQVNATTRNNAAAVDTSGVLTAWDPDLDGTLHTISILGSTVYIGGDFTQVNGATARIGAAAVNNTNGTVNSWVADITGETVRSIYATGTTIYVGGKFSQITGTTTEDRNGAAALDTSGNVLSWDPRIAKKRSFFGPADINVYNVTAAVGGLVFVGGDFSGIGGFDRSMMAAVDSSGSVLSFAPQVSGGFTAGVTSIAVDGSTIYFGGSFTTVNATTRNNVAAVDTSGTLVSGWDPDAAGPVNTLIVVGGDIYFGGSFTTVNGGGTTRHRLAAYDSSGSILPWDPDADQAVNVMVATGTTIYVGGSFSTVGGQSRGKGAAIDTAGTILAWNPDVDGFSGIQGMDVSPNGLRVYIGGQFDNVGGEPHPNLAAVDATTGAPVSSFTPNPGAAVRTIKALGNLVYFGGNFTFVGSSPRNHLAAVSASGVLLDFDPIGTYPAEGGANVFALASDGAYKMYVGGSFDLFSNLAAFSLASFLSADTRMGTVFVTADIPATLSFSIRNSGDTADTNSCTMGALDVSATTTCSYRLKVATNAVQGFTVLVVADHDFGTGSATMTVATDNASAGAGVEAYGIYTVDGATAGGRNPSLEAYDQPVTIASTAGTTFDTAVSPVPTSTAQTIESFTGSFVVPTAPALNQTTLVTHFANIAPATPAGSYGQTLTYTATASF